MTALLPDLFVCVSHTSPSFQPSVVTDLPLCGAITHTSALLTRVAHPPAAKAGPCISFFSIHQQPFHYQALGVLLV